MNSPMKDHNPNKNNPFFFSQTIYHDIILNKCSSDMKKLILEYKKLSLQAQFTVIDHLRFGNPLALPNLEFLITGFKSFAYNAQSDMLIAFDFLHFMQIAEEGVPPPPPPISSAPAPTLDLSPPQRRFLPSFPQPPSGFQPMPPSQSQAHQNVPPASPQVAPLDIDAIAHAGLTKMMMKPKLSKLPLKSLKDNANIISFFKDCKHAPDLPADLFILLNDLFKTTNRADSVIYKAECEKQSWTFAGVFFQILDGNIHKTYHVNYTKILSEVLYTFMRNHSHKIITVLPTILKAYTLASSNSPVGFDEATKVKVRETLKSFYKGFTDDIFISLLLRSQKMKELASSLKFDSVKYPKGILSTTEEEFAPLRLREEEQLHKHLNRYLMTFLNEMLYTAFLVNTRHGWAINQALKITDKIL